MSPDRLRAEIPVDVRYGDYGEESKMIVYGYLTQRITCEAVAKAGII